MVWLGGWIGILNRVKRVESGRQVWEGLLSLFLVVVIATASTTRRDKTGQWDINHVHIHKMRYVCLISILLPPLPEFHRKWRKGERVGVGEGEKREDKEDDL